MVICMFNIAHRHLQNKLKNKTLLTLLRVSVLQMQLQKLIKSNHCCSFLLPPSDKINECSFDINIHSQFFLWSKITVFILFISCIQLYFFQIPISHESAALEPH